MAGAPQLFDLAKLFSPRGRVLEVRPYGHGNVHDTFLVTVAGAAEPHFILQRLNTQVFRRPELVMGNLRTVSEHLHRRLAQESLNSGRRFAVPRVLPGADGRDCVRDPEGSLWRALSFIDRAHTLNSINDLNQAREVGYALGRFHHLLSDLPPHRLADTLPGFHITPGYLRHYDEVLAPQRPASSPEAAYAHRFIEERRGCVHVLEEARARGRLRLRPIHGDPKVNNVMLDLATGRAVALVDLDTVKPGLVHYDIGDCLRSGGNPLGEETEQWEAVRFDPDLCRALLEGYLSQAGGFLTEADHDYLYAAVRLLAFELGLRFFTDYLAGNVYFKAAHRDHNLARALVQFRLTESIESQEAVIGAIVRDLK